MVVLSTGLLIGLAGFGIGVFTTLVLVLLIVIYHNTAGSNEKEEEKDEDHSFVIPMSQLHGAGGPGGYTVADIQRAAAQVRTMSAAKPEETKDVNTGTYL